MVSRRLSQSIESLFDRNKRPRLVASRHREPRIRLEIETLESRELLTGTINGVAFIDANGNGVRDANEVVVKSATINLVAPGATTTAIQTTTTDGSGSFSFSNVAAGQYQLTTKELTGISGIVTVTDNQTTVVNAAFGGLGASSISLREFLASTAAGSFPVGFRTNSSPTASATPLQNLTLTLDNPTNTTLLPDKFTDPDITNTLVQFNLTGPSGSEHIDALLFTSQAPDSVANFLDYATSGAYNGTIFHRLASGFVLQGGGFDTSLNAIPTNGTIPNEFSSSRSNVQGTIAFAKVGSDPNSATDQFFFNLANNASNLDSQNGGFTVFGQIVGAADQAVLNDLTDTTKVTVTDESGSTAPNASALNQLPLINYTPPAGQAFPAGATAANYDVLNSVTVLAQTDALTYSVVSVTPDAGTASAPVTATIAHQRLTVASTGVTGGATVVVQATDELGASVTESFHVSVLGAHAPTATGNPSSPTPVAITPSAPTATSTLTASAAAFSQDGLPVSLKYVWTATDTSNKSTVVQTDNHTVASGTTDTATLNLSTVTAANLATGTTISLAVTPSVQAPSGSSTTELDGTVATASVTLS